MVAGICRVLAKQQKSVAPFKPQNMALNSAATVDGGEIGRAQAVQAQACYLEPHTDMNPILLKPSSDTGAQVIIHGKAIGAISTHDLDLAKTDELEKACQTVHFSEQFTEVDGKKQMTFDYQMKSGIAETTNALKLLEIVGLGEE